jgi:NAD(P)-dependent dehydrogenase (short-subunit alcohol dehydrogenase family)
MAERFHGEGAAVVAVDVPGAQEELVAPLGDRCASVQADVSRSDDVARAIDIAISDFGRQDVLCNHADIDINIASAAGLRSSPMLALYGAAKAAVVMLSRSAAAKYSAQGIRSDTICPGVIDVPLLVGAPAEIRERYAVRAPAGRLGSTDEIAAAALFLASDESSYVTGATLSVDGSMVA